MKTYIKGAHKLTVEEIAPGMDRFTFYEKLGSRWVQMGPAETWRRIARREARS